MERSPSSERLVRMLSSRNPLERRKAAEQLGRGGSAEAIDALHRLALAEPEAWVAGSAVEALALIGSEGALDCIRELAENGDAILGAMAFEALGRVGNAGTVAFLVRSAEDMTRECARDAMLALFEVLERTGAGDLAPEVAEAVRSLLLRVLRDEREDVWMRFRAAGALGRLGEPSVAAELAEVLQRTARTAPTVAVSCARGLKSMGETGDAAVRDLARAGDEAVITVLKTAGCA